MIATRTFRADRGDARERLDRALVRHLADLPEVSRTRVQAWIEAGRVRVNGAAARASARLGRGDEVEVVLPPPPPPRPAPAAQEMPLAILFEDEHLLAVDKPAGLVVHPAPGHRDGTLVNALLWRAREWRGGRPGLVHRLDKDTSGVLLVAKTREAQAGLGRAMMARRIEKEYLAVVYGDPAAERGRIEAKIRADPVDRGRRLASRTEGRDSVTLWRRLGASAGERAGLALLSCALATGRTHQIRVHLAWRGWPIIGDPVYGEPRWKGIRDEALTAACRAFPRQALHARRLAFVHPATGHRIEIAAPLPEDLAGLLAAAGMAGQQSNEPPPAELK